MYLIVPNYVLFACQMGVNSLPNCRIAPGSARYHTEPHADTSQTVWYGSCRFILYPNMRFLDVLASSLIWFLARNVTKEIGLYASHAGMRMMKGLIALLQRGI